MEKLSTSQFAKLADTQKFAFCLMVLDRAHPYLRDYYDKLGRNREPFDLALAAFWEHFLHNRRHIEWRGMIASLYDNCVDSEIDGSIEGMITLNIGLSMGAVANYLLNGRVSNLNEAYAHIMDSLQAFEIADTDSECALKLEKEIEAEQQDIAFLQSQADIHNLAHDVSSRAENYRKRFSWKSNTL